MGLGFAKVSSIPSAERRVYSTPVAPPTGFRDVGDFASAKLEIKCVHILNGATAAENSRQEQMPDDFIAELLRIDGLFRKDGLIIKLDLALISCGETLQRPDVIL